MPICFNVNEYIDSIWSCGGNSSSPIIKGILTNESNSDCEFNKPISVRCIDDTIYVLDSGNSRIKLLNLNGKFIKNISHYGPNDSSCTAMSAFKENSSIHLLTVNWRSKLFCDFELKEHESKFLKADELRNELIQEPIGLMETYN